MSNVPAQSNYQAACGCLRSSTLRVGQQAAVQLQQSRLCNSGKAFKKLRLQHLSPKAFIRVIHSTHSYGSVII